MSKSVLISILNWNSPRETLQCLRGLADAILKSDARVKVCVIDNGSLDSQKFEQSHGEEIAVLGVDIEIVHQPVNLGFAGGHNLSMSKAIGEKWDFVWLLNSDSEVEENVLNDLVVFMEQHENCGAVSPMVATHNDRNIWDFCGAIHQWESRTTHWASKAQEGEALESLQQKDFWLVGTALLLRVDAIREIGVLNDKYFAYYEDNDISVRLMKGGWSNNLCRSAIVRHGYGGEVVRPRPDYYYYLMTRNGLMFWWAHTPREFRKFLMFRLLAGAMYEVNKLQQDGNHSKGNAALRGICDFLRKRSGKPMLEEEIPFWGSLLNKASQLLQSGALKQRAVLKRAEAHSNE